MEEGGERGADRAAVSVVCQRGRERETGKRPKSERSAYKVSDPTINRMSGGNAAAATNSSGVKRSPKMGCPRIFKKQRPIQPIDITTQVRNRIIAMAVPLRRPLCRA